MKQLRSRVDWFLVIVASVLAVSCSGSGCGGCTSIEPIPGGFPAAKRAPNAAQVRVSQTALAKIAADPAAVIGPLLGSAMNGKIEFSIPPSCGSNPEVCCPGGTPSPTCGPLEVDLVAQTGDEARLVLTPVQGASRLDMTIRARVKSKMDLPIKYSFLECGLALDTTKGSTQDLRIDAAINFTQDPTTGTTRISATGVALTQLESEDVKLNGNFGCTITGGFIGAFLGIFTNQIEDTITNAINDAVCKSCESGQLAECGSAAATACTDQTCMIADRCLQTLGIEGRLRGTTLFSSFSPGTTGALDLYEVAGGYATTNQGGIALGVLGGMQPGGAERDRCGPSASEPAAVTVPQSAFFQGNTRPDTDAAFDVAIGVHASQLARFAWAGYDGGLLCLTLGNSTVEQLSTDTLSLVSRSLGNLVESNSAMALGLRPQSPPTITLGANRFMDDGAGNVTIVEPLLDLRLSALEIDFYASIDDHWIRVFTVVTDVHLPIGLQTAGTGELVPVIGDPDDAFNVLEVKHTEAVIETPAQLKGLFPTVLNLVLPQLQGGLGGFELPAIGGLSLEVTDITAVDNGGFLGVFANLVPTTMARPVDTRVTLVGVEEPAIAIARDPSRWTRALAPAVTLDLGSVAGREHSIRIDGGAWSAWSTHPRPRVTSRLFWMPGLHRLEVRARAHGRPETIDRTPEVLEIVLGTDVVVGSGAPVTTLARTQADNGFHGQGGGQGCGCATGTDPMPGGVLALLVAVVIAVPHLRTVTWIAAAVWLSSLPGCSCGSDNPCGAVACLPGELAHGGLGRYTSVAADDKRVLVATYDQGFGDLVVIDATDPERLKYQSPDGVPDVTPVFEPSTYRRGVEEAGEDVGTWSSIAINRGLAIVAYQDRENAALKIAHETKPSVWTSYTLDDGSEDIGSHAAIAIDRDGRPAVAYLALGLDDGMGHRVTELRLARSTPNQPVGESDWTTYVLAKVAGSCAGLCGAGSECVAETPERCIAPAPSCSPACGEGTACADGTCIDIVPDPKVVQLAGGAGLFATIVIMPDGRMGVVYYDRAARSLVIALETAPGANDYAPTTLDAAGDRGMWASAIVDGTGTVHVAYQDALADRLMYVSYAGTAGTPEVVDDGARPGERGHHVGAASAIFLDNGAPVIAYQDGTNADVLVARRGGASWTTSGLATGRQLDGFSIGAASHGGTPVLAWGAIDPTQSPGGLVVVSAP